MDLKDKAVAICGLGLIGGSLAWSLKRLGRVGKVTGFDVNPDTLTLASERGIVDVAADNVEEAVRDSDIVVLCVPVRSIPSLGKKVAPFLKSGCVVTDVGSCKHTIVSELDAILPQDVYFVGGHPMAGSEQSGLEGARPDLFEKAFWALTPTPRTEPAAVEMLTWMIRGVGAKPVILDPKVHDSAVAYASHLPYLAAVALTLTAEMGNHENPFVSVLSATGFRDTTRVASSNPDMSFDFCAENRGSLLEASKRFIRIFEQIVGLLESGDGGLLHQLKQAKQFRDSLVKSKGW